ncbi:hypothetical protein ACOMHN_013063 [Nucella lapillus]
MMSFPAHTTHRLQPLDVTFFKSLKNWYNIEIENYLRSSQAKAVGVHLVNKPDFCANQLRCPNHDSYRTWAYPVTINMPCISSFQ